MQEIIRNPGGRPRKQISKEDILGAYAKYNNWEKVAVEFGVSKETLYRRIREHGIKSFRVYH